MPQPVSLASIHDKITRTVNAGAKKKAFGIVKQLEPILSQAMDDFFASVVPLIGHEVDLNSQVKIPGLFPWHPLSLDYEKRKGATKWFLYTSLLSSTPQKRRRSSFDILAGRGPTLEDTLSTIKGSQVFGETKIEVTDFRNFPVTLASIDPSPRTVDKIKFTLKIKPFGTLRKSNLDMLESYFVARGVFDHDIFNKLTNPRGKKRPLLRPWLAHWADVVIPVIIESALRERFGRQVTVKVARPWDTGPF